MDNQRYYDIKGEIYVSALRSVVLSRMRDALFEQHCLIEHKDESSIVFSPRGTAHYPWLRGTFMGTTRGVITVESTSEGSIVSYQICLAATRVGIAILFVLLVFVGVLSHGLWPGIVAIIPAAVFYAAAYASIWMLYKMRISWFLRRILHRIASETV
jgi:hypothetical protein